MSECHHRYINSSVYQTLDELEFDRGIWSAAQNNDIPRVLKLLGDGVNVNAADKAGYTALHYASRNGHLKLCEILLFHNADVNLLTKAGRASSLHRTASAGHLDVFRLLIKYGAITNLKDSDGKTVLHRAVEADNENIVNVILEVAPQLVEERDNKGKLPIHITKSDSIKNILKKNLKQ